MMKWAKIPSVWIQKGGLKEFTAHRDIVDKISAIKLFIIFCIKMEHGKDGRFTCSLTYEQLTEIASLSRSSVRKGLIFLDSKNIIYSEGVRNKVYIINNVGLSGWCKIPIKALMKNADEIEPFKILFNRYGHELNALKLYLYLLAIRDNDSAFSEVSIGKITTRTGISAKEVRVAFSFMQTMGLLNSVEEVVGSVSDAREDGILFRFLITCGPDLVFNRNK